MSTVTPPRILIGCDRDDCTGIFVPSGFAATDDEARAEAAACGWTVERVRKFSGIAELDICPRCGRREP